MLVREAKHKHIETVSVMDPPLKRIGILDVGSNLSGVGYSTASKEADFVRKTWLTNFKHVHVLFTCAIHRRLNPSRKS